jgi:hypothetical protein
MSDLIQFNVHGPVQTLRIEGAEWDLTGEMWLPPRSSNMVHFRHDGKISKSEHRNPDGSVSHSGYSYDESDRLTETQFQVNDGPIHRNICHYDEFGRLIQTVRVDESGVQQSSETFSYDSAGRKTKVQAAPTLANETLFLFGIEGTDSYYSAAGAATMTTVYDDREQPVEALLHDANRRLLRRMIFIRDRTGKLVKEEMHLGDDQTPFPEFEKASENASPEERAQVAAMFARVFGPRRIMSSATHVYDEKGRRAERRVQWGEISEERFTYRFDAHDNLTEETHEQTQRDVNSNEAGELQPANEVSTHEQWRNAYRYDDHGNWTERVRSVRLEQNPEFQPTNIERRIISYYDA